MTTPIMAPTSPTIVAVAQSSHVARGQPVDAGEEWKQQAPTTNVGTPIARLRAISASAEASKRRPQQLHLVRTVRRLDLAEPVEVAHVRRHGLDVRDDDVARDELDAPAHEGVNGPKRGSARDPR